MPRRTDRKKRDKDDQYEQQKEAIITYHTAIKRIAMEQYKQLYPHNFDNFSEIDQFPESYNLPKLPMLKQKK